MFVQVQLLSGYTQPLWYTIPSDWQCTSPLLGTFIRVPLRKKLVSGIIVNETSHAPSVSFSIKAAHSIEPFPHDDHYQSFLQSLGTYYQVNPLLLLKRIRHFIAQKQIDSLPFAPEEQPNNSLHALTEEQQLIVENIKPYLNKQGYEPFLVHGVTGSGKTEVYKSLILEALKLNKTVLLLFPEVTLALSFEQRLKHELGPIALFGFHSASAAKEKKRIWQMLIDQHPCIILGVHMPILLPIANLGLIIIDEEHEIGYQEKKHPKIHTKEAALLRARFNNIPIVLGSATPSLHALYMVHNKQWHFHQLKKRFAGSFPTIEIVHLLEDRTHKKSRSQRKNFWISQPLHDAIEQQLAQKKQTILFINRRGYSFFLQCRQCSFIPVCTQCSVSLTLHDQARLSCHYCGYEIITPTQCPSCKAPEKELLKKGIGTQQVVATLEQLFPTAHIARADLDTTTKKKLWGKIIQDMHTGAIDILVGTQSITKGLDFAGVTLVGIIWADLNLNMPLFNAAETTLQQLIQVAGRAGRHGTKSRVIIQTMGDHELLNYVHEQDYLTFYNEEIAIRKSLSYPPIIRLIEIELKYHDEAMLEQEAVQYATMLRNNPISTHVTILGPVKPLVYKIKNSFSYKIYIKAARIDDAITLFNTIDKKQFASSIFFTPNPTR